MSDAIAKNNMNFNFPRVPYVSVVLFDAYLS